MSKRNTSDAEVQKVVDFINHITQEAMLIEMTETWSEADVLYAIERVEIKQPKERRDQVRGLYRTLRIERRANDARVASEEASTQRHNEISKRLNELSEISRLLDELKKPHWSIVPNFWFTVAILILTAIGVIVAVLAFRH